MRVSIATDTDGYYIFFPDAIDTRSNGSNVLTIQAETVQTVDELDFHAPSELYMLDMINKLESLADASAEGNVLDGRT